MTELLLSFF